MLGVGEIEGGVDFVEDIHGSGLELEQGHNEGERDERPLPAAQLRQALLPDTPEPYFDLESVHEVLTVRWLQFSEVAWK